MKELIIQLLNTEAAQTVIVSVLAYAFAKLVIKAPKVGLFFEKYKDAMIHAVKLAEAEIPDDTPNKALDRLDRALIYAIKLIENAEGKDMTIKQKHQLRSDLSAVHNEVQ